MSETIGEVERLLRTEMADLEQFYAEFGEHAGQVQRGEHGPGAQVLGGQVARQRERVADPLRNSTRFMKSGDFFEYIENMVEEDLKEKETPVASAREVQPRVLEQRRPKKEELKNLNINMSHARNLDVQMNEQSTFLEQVQPPNNFPSKRAYTPEKTLHEMNQIEEVEEVEPISDEPEPSLRQRQNAEPSWRRNNDFNKSVDDRAISTKKKTFEEMLEEALKKEGQVSFEQPAPAPVASVRKSNFLKKNTSRRRFLNKKKNAKSRYGRPNFKKKNKKPKKEEIKPMTESMLEFEQMEQINGNQPDDVLEALSIQEEQDEEEEEKLSKEEEEAQEEEEEEEEEDDEEIEYKFLKMGKAGDHEQEDEEPEKKGISERQLKAEVAKIKRQVEAKFKRKIDELNREINKYKSRNKTLEEDKKKIAKLKKKIQEDKALVDRLKADKQDFENYKQKEMEKLRKEKAHTKRNAKAYRANANKKDKETIENLKKELRIAREQAMNKERKLKEAIDRRKRTIEEFKIENEELRGQVDFYEKMRINQKKQKNKRKREESEEEPSDEPESADDSIDSEPEKEEQPVRNVRSLKSAVEQLGKKKGKKGAEIKKFLTEFYAGFENPIPNVDKGTLKINNENYKFDENTHYKKYKWNRETDLEVVQEEEAEGKIYKTFSDGRKEIKFSNGAVKEIMPDGYIIGIQIEKIINFSAFCKHRHQANAS